MKSSHLAAYAEAQAQTLTQEMIVTVVIQLDSQMYLLTTQ